MHITLFFQEKLILNFYFVIDEVIGFVQTAETINCPIMCLWAKTVGREYTEMIMITMYRVMCFSHFQFSFTAIFYFKKVLSALKCMY